MKIMVVDNQESTMNDLAEMLHQQLPNGILVTFSTPGEAFDYLAAHAVDIAFLDMETNGLALAQRCKDVCPRANIIIIAACPQYALEALRLHVSGYLLKPVCADDLRAELANLRYPLPPPEKRVRMQTFGNFEVFVGGKPLKFPRTKCRECLAYLVDRKGASVSFAQLTTILWDRQPLDRSAQKNTHKIISDLTKALKEVGAENILRKSRTDIAIFAELVDCDYFLAVSGNRAWLDSFTGEYMTNYSWGEFTLGELVERRQREIR